MKRIYQTSETFKSTPDTDSLKPLFGTKAEPPYYDPNDLHVHIWKNGKLGLEDNPKKSTYAKGKLVIKNCIYCRICHQEKDKFQSTEGLNKDVLKDVL
jgi:hypothetical protein